MKVCFFFVLAGDEGIACGSKIAIYFSIIIPHIVRYWNSTTTISSFQMLGGGSEKHEKLEKLENAFGLSGYQRIAIVRGGGGGGQ